MSPVCGWLEKAISLEVEKQIKNLISNCEYAKMSNDLQLVGGSSVGISLKHKISYMLEKSRKDSSSWSCPLTPLADPGITYHC